MGLRNWSVKWSEKTKQNKTKLILNFIINQLYPGQDITNVMESPEPVTVPNWCKAGQKNCKHNQHTVYPYRCIGECQLVANLNFI